MPSENAASISGRRQERSASLGPSSTSICRRKNMPAFTSRPSHHPDVPRAGAAFPRRSNTFLDRQPGARCDAPKERMGGEVSDQTTARLLLILLPFWPASSRSVSYANSTLPRRMSALHEAPVALPSSASNLSPWHDRRRMRTSSNFLRIKGASESSRPKTS